MRFFRALKKDYRESKLAYYQVLFAPSTVYDRSALNGCVLQAGIGTYNKRQFITHTLSTAASVIDQAVALHLNDHVKEG